MRGNPMNDMKSFYRILAGVMLATALALLPSCGSKDSRSLVLVDVPVTGFADPGNQIDVKVRVGDSTVAEQKYPTGSAATAHLGIYLPSGTDGQVTVVVSIVASGCAIATGTSSVPVKSGETSAVVTITLVATNACGVATDAGIPAPSDGGADQAVVDAGSRGADTSSVSVDVATAGTELGSAIPDAAPDRAGLVVDAPMDLPVPVEVAAPGPDLGPDSPADAPTTMNLLANCTKYTHSK